MIEIFEELKRLRSFGKDDAKAVVALGLFVAVAAAWCLALGGQL